MWARNAMAHGKGGWFWEFPGFHPRRVSQVSGNGKNRGCLEHGNSGGLKARSSYRAASASERPAQDGASGP